MTGIIDLMGGAQLMSTNDERAIPSFITGKMPHSGTMPRLATCARAKT